MKIYQAGLADIAKAKQMIDDDLAAYAQAWQQAADQGSAMAIEAYCQILLRGGKRLRGVLAMQSYYAHGGTDDAVALGAARALELIQAYLLVLDDIADRSDTRRGGPSAHRLAETMARGTAIRGDVTHYATMQVMNAAQSAAHKAALELLALPVNDAVARAALQSLHHNIEVTSIGQMNDIYNEATNEIPDEAAIERVLTQKSAYYTFVNPLELGACLAGRETLDETARTYALHAGCAFQIADDIIGTFGSEAATGKSANDDIREGKMTLIAQYGLTHADSAQQTILRSTLGNQQATDADCDKVRQILTATGAYNYTITRGDWHAGQARSALDGSVSFDPAFGQFLDKLVTYVTTRQA
jgi:geranylgeranyl diphosphate synthase type I